MLRAATRFPNTYYAGDRAQITLFCIGGMRARMQPDLSGKVRPAALGPISSSTSAYHARLTGSMLAAERG